MHVEVFNGVADGRIYDARSLAVVKGYYQQPKMDTRFFL